MSKSKFHFNNQLQLLTTILLFVLFSFSGNASTNKITSAKQDSAVILKKDFIQKEIKDKKDHLFIINGVEKSKAEFDKINPEEIDAITILNGVSATMLYGQKAKNGVITVDIKKIEIPKDKKIFIIRDNGAPNGPIYIINEVQLAPGSYLAIAQEDIKNVTELKSTDAIAKYGDKAKNGAIVVETTESYKTKKLSLSEKFNVTYSTDCIKAKCINSKD